MIETLLKPDEIQYIIANPDRCYWCKHLTILHEVCNDAGFTECQITDCDCYIEEDEPL